LKTVEAAALKSLLKKKQGKVVLINLWATWCVPCREEFPDLIKLHGKYRSRGLELILISVDDTEQREPVEAFLKENGVTFPTYINAEENYEDLIGFIAPDWIGGFPTTFVIDRKGRLTRSLVGGQSYEVFHKAVAPLL
jgi:thiol-disulfide isomerase/thioredoxin